MANVKIYLEPHETEEDAKEALAKALTQSEVKDEHKQDFHQPAAKDVFSKMIVAHDKMWEKMLKEINQVIDEEGE